MHEIIRPDTDLHRKHQTSAHLAGFRSYFGEIICEMNFDAMALSSRLMASSSGRNLDKVPRVVSLPFDGSDAVNCTDT
jgi:hypothetical protein